MLVIRRKYIVTRRMIFIRLTKSRTKIPHFNKSTNYRKKPSSIKNCSTWLVVSKYLIERKGTAYIVRAKETRLTHQYIVSFIRRQSNESCAKNSLPFTSCTGLSAITTRVRAPSSCIFFIHK